jgi:hypothetical protein
MPRGGVGVLYNAVEFVEAKSADSGWLYEVVFRGVVTGRICQNDLSDTYVYYRIPGSGFAPFHEEKDLARLISQVTHMP